VQHSEAVIAAGKATVTNAAAALDLEKQALAAIVKVGAVSKHLRLLRMHQGPSLFLLPAPDACCCCSVMVPRMRMAVMIDRKQVCIANCAM
jgi:hypothetical protein